MTEPVTPERLEALVLSCLRTEHDVVSALKLGIATDSFEVAEHRTAWNRLLAAVQAGTALPTLTDLREGGVAAVSDVDDLASYAEELAKRSLANRAYGVLHKLVPRIRQAPTESVRDMVGELSDLLTVTDLHVSELDSGADERYKRVEELVETVRSGRVIGIPTGLEVFDSNMQTWREGELGVVFAYQNVGKSFMLVHFCCQAYNVGKRVLLVSPESPAVDMEWRADVMLSRLNTARDWKFTLTQLRNGTVDLEEYKAWCQGFDRKDWKTVDSGEHGPFSISDIIALAREHRPDVLAVDGMHLIVDDDKDKASWVTLKEAGSLLKGLAQNLNMVVIVAAQAKRETGIFTDDPPEPHEIAYGHAIAESASRMIALGRPRGSPLRRTFNAPKMRDGAVVLARHYLTFDVDNGLIRQVVKG